MTKPIGVLVVDDSVVARTYLTHTLEADPLISVVGVAGGGAAALAFIRRTMPDVVLMDVNMPGLDGYETTRQIMASNPVPIVICSASENPKEVATVFRVLEAGAVACARKPMGAGNPESEQIAAELCQTVRLMSEIMVVKRRFKGDSPSAPPAPAKVDQEELAFVGIGASTGGPPALCDILGELPADFPVPILVVQHIAVGFLPGLAVWLNDTSPLQVEIGVNGDRPLPGHVYLAPDSLHMGVTDRGRIRLNNSEPERGGRPAVSYLFRSLSEVCGPGAVGILLTGMGDDGAEELKLMKDMGAVTIAQDLETSVVHGMPGKAIALGGATHVLPVTEIAKELLKVVARHNGRARRLTPSQASGRESV